MSSVEEGRVYFTADGIGGMGGKVGMKNAEKKDVKEMKEMKELSHPKWATPTIAVYTYGGEYRTSRSSLPVISSIYLLYSLLAILL